MFYNFINDIIIAITEMIMGAGVFQTNDLGAWMNTYHDVQTGVAMLSMVIVVIGIAYVIVTVKNTWNEIQTELEA